ncbi:MAG: ATP-binding cassette domain-containing protein [Nitrospirae bacterium]|nr:ATP-binding cassette domain-containing protein [Nitrospirota bacterium]MCL5978170.1 ATP-binding cassette domain-containing protein [Nitrospirota bacterium]
MGLRLDVLNISKSYDGKPVLRDCSLSFDKADVYALMGQNGTGKSTFLRICALLENPDNGEVNYFSGSGIISKDIELRRRITLVLPKIGIFNTTVFQNAAYGLKIRGIKGNEMENRVEKALDFVGLIHKKDQNALTLSSGEAQRLGIARAIVIEPEILFLDEPTASVDEENTRIIENIILSMKEEGGSIIIITTHDRSQAERLADTLLIMRGGTIIRS